MPLEMKQVEKLANKMQTLTEIEICIINNVDITTFARFEYFFQHFKQLKTIRFKLLIIAFKCTDPIYEMQVENARKFL